MGSEMCIRDRLSPELLQEGLAREIVRTIQDARKQADLQIADRIELRISGSDAVTAAVDAYRDFIGNEVLASRWHDASFEHGHAVERSLGDDHWSIQFGVDEAG